MEPIEVSAVAIRDGEGRVLLCRRTGTLEGRWEFPGGKREKGETMAQCARRELLEELGVHARLTRALCQMPWETPEKNLLFTFFEACLAQGETPELRVHSAAEWVAPEKIGAYTLCDADAAFINTYYNVLLEK
ncbi:MAG: NUDIX domain-containing protein [Clostridia bacterium]|nr:NUDIX domain-containing protein [Clostridia bacterium]